MNEGKLLCPSKKVDVILDTDTYNEIDDQFAVAYLLKNSDRLNCVGLTAAPFFNSRSSSPKDGMEKSYDEIIRLLKLLNRSDVPVYRGSENYLADENTGIVSDAAEAIVRAAKEHSSESPLYVVAIGAITNVASAILSDKSILDKIVIVWLGGNGRQFNSANEFNMMQDIAAARVVMGCGAPFVQLPCAGVVDIFRTCESELKEWLYNKTELSQYLAENTVKYCNPNGERKIWSKVIWDVTAVAWLINDNNRFMNCRITDTLLPGYDLQYEATPINKRMCYVEQINRDALMADLFEKITGR